MGTRLSVAVGMMLLVLSSATNVFAQLYGEGVEIYKERSGVSVVYDGGINISVEGEGITSLLLTHPKLGAPVTILQNTAGFDEIEFDRGEEWTAFTKLIPNGSYQLTIKLGALTVNHPFVVDYSLMPAVPTITSPTDGQVLPEPSLVVTWNSPPPGVDAIYVSVESDNGGCDFESGYLPPGSTYYIVPSSILEPGRSYGVDVEFTRGGNGVLYFSDHEVEFSIAP
ncbi:MAG: hypothetical protein C4520_00365 [Candidatus Abyssobacteria bacterium SURF_5]|uniref:Fibronectin type-III domain-containing protein n=1 Tax=Abyssobacteria bacterium (strain SURF_5) TaxID=2093360 RepID=A0A3A4PFA8_ABYX5|nr:MAG: hypothetical protein C4520_00365 [Candidatus Abyssubacteria bacterium SURF_5]